MTISSRWWRWLAYTAEERENMRRFEAAQRAREAETVRMLDRALHRARWSFGITSHHNPFASRSRIAELVRQIYG